MPVQFLTVFCNVLKNMKRSVQDDTEIYKMAGSSTDFLSGKGLEAIFSFTESEDSFDDSPQSASMVTETCWEMQTEESDSDSRTECSKAFKTSRGLHFSSKNIGKNFHAFDYEVILPN